MKDASALVFVVDDDASVRKSLTRLLTSAGHLTETFSSAQKFLDYPVFDGPSCLVLDVFLPGLDGLQLQDKLSAAGRVLPIIFISGHGDIPMSVRTMKAGAVNFLPKPFNGEALLQAVQEALRRSRLERQMRHEADSVAQRLAALTPREREVLRHVVAGQLNKQIAGDLGIAEKTVKVHRGRVMAKMQAESVAELVRLAQQVGIPGDASPVDRGYPEHTPNALTVARAKAGLLAIRDGHSGQSQNQT